MIKYKINGNKTIAYFYNNDLYSGLYVWTKAIKAQVMKKLNIPKHYYIRFDIEEIARETLMNKTKFYGVAKCSPDDIFDEETGKQIAKERLLQDFYKYRDKVLQKVIDKINKIPHVGYHIFNENSLFDKLNHIVAFEKTCGIKNDMEVYEYESSD